MSELVGVTVMSTKGQVVIPQGIREKMGMKAGTPFVVRVHNGKIILEVVK